MNTILALDIGTEYIKAIIAKPSKKGNIEILGAGKAKQPKGAMSAGAIADISAVVTSCEEALVEAEEEAKETANLAVVGIAGELIRGNTTTVNYDRENPNKPISEDEMSKIIEKVQAKTGEIAKKTVALETGNDDVEIRLINSAIVSLTIDGYKINNPIGFKGSKVVIQFYTAFAPLVHIAAIEKVCAELNLELLTVAVEPFAICRACLGDQPDSGLSGIIADIGGGTTDIAIINDGSVEGTESFNIGAEKADKTPAIWLSGLEIALEGFTDFETLPSNIYLCGGGADKFNLQAVLATNNWYQSLPFSRRPIVNLVEMSELPDLTFKTPKELGYDFITAAGLLRVGLDTLISSPEETSLKAKISRLLQK